MTQSGGERISRAHKSRVEAVASGLEDDAALGFNARTQQAIVIGEGRLHRLGVAFPQLRAPFDVGEQKRHHALGKRLGNNVGATGDARQIRCVTLRCRHRFISDLGSRSFDEQRTLLSRNRELGGQSFGQLLARSQFARLDPPNCFGWAADLRGELLMGERLRPAVGREHVAE